jgi:hypothetical protein
MRRLFALLAFAAAAAPAVACINDSELPSHEREFRSSYQAERKPEPLDSGYKQYIPGTAAAVGGVLLLGAGIITARRLFGRG